MFLFDYFYGTNKSKQSASGQGQDDEWILVDNNIQSTSTNKIPSVQQEEHVFVEKDETFMDQFEPELKPKIVDFPREPTPTPAEEEEAEESKEEEGAGAVGGRTELEVQNPSIGVGWGRVKPRVSGPPPILNSTNLNNFVKAETGKPKNNNIGNNCKKQSQRQQRRADKYKNGVWSGKSNDRKCGKCY